MSASEDRELREKLAALKQELKQSLEAQIPKKRKVEHINSRTLDGIADSAHNRAIDKFQEAIDTVFKDRRE